MGFAHNAVVVQTGTPQESAFVTVTGGGACTGGTIVKFYNGYAAGTFRSSRSEP